MVGVGLAVLADTALAHTRGRGALPENASVVLFAVLCAGWVVLPVLTFASDDLLDPTRLALLPLTRRQLLTVMGTGALIGVAPVATAVAACGLLPATAHGAAPTVVALLAVALLLLLCVSASRAAATALSGLLRSRRGRDLGVALAAVLGLGFQLVNPLLRSTQSQGAQAALRGPASVLRWSPPGLLATAPGRSLPGAAACLLAVAAVTALLLASWERSVRRTLERPDTTGSGRRRATGLAPAGLPLPAGRVGAVAAKDLRYVVREPRRLISLVTSTLLPVLAVALGPLVSGSRPHGLVFAVCGIGLLGGLAGANRFGLDGTATWLLLSSATDPQDARRDLLGGDLAVGLVTGPLLVLAALVLAALTGGWELLPPAVGCGLALLAVVLGLSGLVSVRAPYAVPPTQNAFGGGSPGQGCAAGALTVAGLVGGVALCLPLLALLLPALVTGRPAWGLALLVVGPAYGLGVGAVLRRYAARAWARRGPEVLQLLAAAPG